MKTGEQQPQGKIESALCETKERPPFIKFPPRFPFNSIYANEDFKSDQFRIVSIDGNEGHDCAVLSDQVKSQSPG